MALESTYLKVATYFRIWANSLDSNKAHWDDVMFEYVQGISYRNGLYELALKDKHINVRFGLKMIQECWDREFLGTKTIFQKSKV